MPAWYIHTISNLIIFIPILLLLKIFSWELLVLIIAWGVLIDLDHLPYFIAKLRTFNFSKILKEANKDFESDTIHFYPLHTLEFFLIFGIILLLANFDIMSILLFLAGLLHWLLDGIRHYIRHKNFYWLKYFSIIYYLLKK